MEFNPGNLVSPEASSSDKDTKKEKRKNSANLKIPIAVGNTEMAEKRPIEKPPVNMFDRALADLAIKQKNERAVAEVQTAEKSAAEKPSQDVSEKAEVHENSHADIRLEAEHAELLAEAAAVPPELREQTHETEDDDTEEAKRKKEFEPKSTEQPKETKEEAEAEPTFRHTELQPHDLPLGEGIVHLRGETPLAEREIVLERTPAQPVAEDMPEPEPSQEPIPASQPPEQSPSGETSIPETTPEGAAANNGGDVPPVEPPNTGERSFEEPEEPDEPHTASFSESSATTPQPQAEADPATTAPNMNPGPTPNMVPNPNTNQPNPNTIVPTPIVTPNQYNTYTAPNGGPTSNPNYYTAPPANSNPNTQPSITQQQLEDEVHRAHKVGNNRGVLAGLLVGGAYEHFKHRRREKREEKRQKEQTRRWEKQQASQNFTVQEQQRKLAEAERQRTASAELPAPVVAQAVTSTERSNNVAAPDQMRPGAPNRPPSAEQSAQLQPELSAVTAAVAFEAVQPPTMERRFPAATQGMAERQLTQASEQNARATTERYHQTAEHRFSAKLEKLLPKRSEKKHASKDPEIVDQLEIPADHRLETSSWHTIEVDAKTGKPVENPTFQYGSEYYRERAHEASPRDDNRNAAAGEVALVAAAMANSSTVTSSQNGAPHNSKPTLPPLMSQHDAKKPRDTAKATLQNVLQSSGPIWPWIIAFAVVVFLIIVAL